MNQEPRTTNSFFQTLWIFLRLGLTSFGGPTAHLGYFREEFVVRRRWLEERTFADLVALSQFLPGPSSSQVNLAIGLHRGGWSGALAAWIGFTLPSAILMVGFAYGIGFAGDLAHVGWLQGLKLAAVAVVAQAVWAMATKLCAERITATIALLGAMIILGWSSPWNQVMVIVGGSFAGWVLFRSQKPSFDIASSTGVSVGYGRRFGAVLLLIFFFLLLVLPIFLSQFSSPLWLVFDRFYRAGSLVFGGGHVVLPVLQSAVVDTGWLDNNRFLAGYAAAQALPGPLFAFAAFLGCVISPGPHGWLGALWSLFAIYLPGTLLMFGALPYWEKIRQEVGAQAALQGANAAVVGLLLAALYHPIWTSGVHTASDFVLVLADFALIALWKCPPWLVVSFSAAAGGLFLTGSL